MSTPVLTLAHPAAGAIGNVGESIFDFINQIPKTGERASADPDVRARQIAKAASSKAALAAGALALPPGALGWLTILPELIGIWRIQGQMVADIAATYGKRTELTREQMVYCLFRHAAAQALRDVAVRVGGRVLFQQISTQAMQKVARKIGVHVSQRALGKIASRWLPIIGAVGTGAYAYYDTGQVASTAIEIFGREEA